MSFPIITDLQGHALALAILCEHEAVKRVCCDPHEPLSEIEYQKARAFDRIVKTCRKELAIP